MGYKTIIGLEIHTELMTKTKMFCNCANEFGSEANTNCCPVCIGLPGALPVINKTAMEFALKAGMAFNCNINVSSRMDRKNYYYPDLVKGYQITQDETPLCEEGYIEIDLGTETKRVHLQRIHVEEDTGKQIHTLEGDTLIDYNRSGVPLIEIVTKPEMNNGEEARLFLENLKDTLKYLDVSDCKMEEGSLRCDVNINVVNLETGEKSKITEIKNLNSFRSAVKSIEFEEKRHIALLESGSNTEKETRRWDETKNETIKMRTKAGVADYRYAPDGDLAPIVLEETWINEIRNNLPELPSAKKERFIKEYNLEAYDAGVLTSSKELAKFFEETKKHIDDAKLISNWIMGDVLRRLKEDEVEIQDTKLSAKSLAELISTVKEGKINNNTGKKVLKEMFDTGKSADEIIKEQGLVQISDESEIVAIVSKVLDENPQSIEDFKNGKDRAIGFLVGQIMKQSKGKANPQIVNKLVSEMIKER